MMLFPVGGCSPSRPLFACCATDVCWPCPPVCVSATGLGGLGVVMQATGNDAMPYLVNSIDTDGTAFQDGRLRVGDGLLMLDGKSTIAMDMSDVTSLVRGTPGSLYVSLFLTPVVLIAL